MFTISMFAISSFSQSPSPKQIKSIVMDCSTFSTPKLWFFCAFLLFIIMCVSIVSGTATEINYGPHCNSVVHESKPGDEEFNVMPFAGRQNGYFRGGDNVLILNNRSHMYYPSESKALVFETRHVYATDVEDVFKVEGDLIFQTSYYYEQSFNRDGLFISSSRDSGDRGTMDFDFQGFWSRTTGELCMVGSSDTYSDEGKLLQLAAVLKINNLKSSSDISTLVTGTIASLNSANDPNYFDKISLLMFPQVNYGYTMASKQFNQGCPLGTDVQPKLSLSLSLTRTICDMLSGGDNAFKLEYSSGCDSSKRCSPFGDVIGYLPTMMSLSMIQCSADRLSLRFLIEFRNNSYRGYYSSPNISTSLIGEGTWDAKSNRLCIIACRIYDALSSLETSRVGDCTTRLSLRFPAVLSIRYTGTVVGEIWSLKKRNEAGFFDRIEFQNTGNHRGKIQLQGLKYEYTEMDRVKKSCPKKNPRTRSSRVQYPDSISGDMGFSMSILNGSKVNIGWGSSDILAVSDQSNQRFPYLIPSSSSKPKHPGVKSNSSSGSLNISYKMTISVPSWEVYPGLTPVNKSSNEYLETELMISAEGIYDTATGSLCMVGCSRLISGEKSFSSHSMDCEILLNVYFPPQDSNGRSKIKGSIESMRENTDPLYFKPMQFSGWAHYRRLISESIWRMNFEMIMSVISNTLAIIFVAFQIFHVRKHRGAGLLVSLLMLVILALGHLIPLVLNLEAMFEQDSERSVLIRGGTWIEMNEVIIRVVTMVAFLLQTRLLMLSWTTRCSTGKKKALWTAEKRGLYVCFPVYITGAMIAFYVKSRQTVHQTRRHSWHHMDQIILRSSRPYAGLILDAFLFPQIIFNMFQNSRELSLSRFYYIGITVVRLFPHVYDLYRANTYADIEDTYIYADHAADYYSTAWDFIIIVLGLFFAATIHYQQRLGGRCLLPNRFQESVIDEELPVDSEEQLPLKYST
ncbi:Detected protein of unknown function [Hibiscus syriacus]|uniref:RING-type E3 ubiquitin transferase n=1 Tax=Hibiscus syriacus TaxID=106335 RepID=A0A6A2ZLS2_HIBSY|nr:uncharacterized protein LOC120143939 [Hibiscus syriacus]KAE8691875.1 Detected protein of unknown function [Hibiscus syriacus]